MASAISDWLTVCCCYTQSYDLLNTSGLRLGTTAMRAGWRRAEPWKGDGVAYDIDQSYFCHRQDVNKLSTNRIEQH